MFRVISTGKNKNYGKKGEKINIGDSSIVYCLKEDWVSGTGLEYLGTSYGGKTDQTPKTKEGFIIQKINVEKLIEMQNRALDRIEKELKFIKQKKDEVMTLLKNEP